MASQDRTRFKVNSVDNEYKYEELMLNWWNLRFQNHK